MNINNTLLVHKRAIIPSIITIIVFLLSLTSIFFTSFAVSVVAIMVMIVCIVYFFAGCKSWIYTQNKKEVCKKEYYFRSQDLEKVKQLFSNNEIHSIKALSSNDNYGGGKIDVWTSKDDSLILAQLYEYAFNTYTPISDLKVCTVNA